MKDLLRIETFLSRAVRKYMELKIRKARRLDIRGLVIWGSRGNGGSQMLEVFSADLKVAAKKDQLETWTLRFGRKGKEGRRVPYGETKELLGELRKPRGWEWAEEFTKDRS